MNRDKRQFAGGFTLVELVITIVISAMLMSVVGVLLVGGQRAWQKTYESAHGPVRIAAQDVTVTFGSMARKANRNSYILYERSGSVFTPAEPDTSGEEVVEGDAIEFRYWDVELDSEDSHDLMDISKTATAYAFFYIDGGVLKVDYGPYPPGAVSQQDGRRNTNDITTRVLAENVRYDPNYAGPFSHTTISETGVGSAKINVIVYDPNDTGNSVRVMAAGLLRNIWPR